FDGDDEAAAREAGILDPFAGHGGAGLDADVNGSGLGRGASVPGASKIGFEEGVIDGGAPESFGGEVGDERGDADREEELVAVGHFADQDDTGEGRSYRADKHAGHAEDREH